MTPRMTSNELLLFKSFLQFANTYVEFGSGGSTVLAGSMSKTIYSIDSSRGWLNDVKAACGTLASVPNLIFVNIGPLGEWGHPANRERYADWPHYHESIWTIPECRSADLYFVDGRFRVACFAQIVLNCTLTPMIGFHDFTSRPQYHCVRKISREIARVEDMSFFLGNLEARDEAQRLLDEYRFDPS